MFKSLDPLVDFGCPHCGASLRFRWVRQSQQSSAGNVDPPYVCPLCEGRIIWRRHPAIADNWLWSRFYMPGVILCALGIFVPALGWLLPFAVGALALGFIALIVYMVRERWGWKCYGVYPEAPEGSPVIRPGAVR